MTIIPLASPSDELLALLPDEDTVRGLLLRVRQRAYMEGAAIQQCSNQAAFEQGFRAGKRAGKRAAVERDSATTYGAGYDSGYQDGVRATRQAGP